METVEERVARGATLLDNTYQGWRAIVDADAIDMSACGLDVRSLITGEQVKVSYSEAETAWEFAHGFWPDNEEEWGDLTRAWREQLA